MSVCFSRKVNYEIGSVKKLAKQKDFDSFLAFCKKISKKGSTTMIDG